MRLVEFSETFAAGKTLDIAVAKRREIVNGTAFDLDNVPEVSTDDSQAERLTEGMFCEASDQGDRIFEDTSWEARVGNAEGKYYCQEGYTKAHAIALAWYDWSKYIWPDEVKKRK